MTGPGLLAFLPLAVLTSTAFPVSFDPVLIHFAVRHPQRAVFFALAGWSTLLPGRRGVWFYAWTLCFACLPLPFSVIRLALLDQRPHPVLYSLAVALGRLPR